MKVFVSSLNVPIGYTTPPFPLLYWPFGRTEPQYSQLVLYYTRDVWSFTVIWYVIIFVSFYSVAAAISCINSAIQGRRKDASVRRILTQMVFLAGSFLVGALCMSFVSGTVVGLLLSVVYRAGSMTMSTWIPFTWAAVGILYDICSSYSTSQITL